MVAAQQTPALFKPIKLGRLLLQHRVVLAPLTRYRAYDTHVPGPQSASYYAQRASAPGSLLITEATIISHNAGGFAHVPGVYTDAQIQGWKKVRVFIVSRFRFTESLFHQVTDAVHAKGSHIFLQVWALGRTADPEFLQKQDPPAPYVSASSVPVADSKVAPRPLTEAEIKHYIVAYAKAASNAVHRAGFDGVEIHNANGYLPDQFLQSVSNKRTDKWGGDEEGRTRFSREIVDAVVDAVGADRVGIRVSPWNPGDVILDVIVLICMLMSLFTCLPDLRMPDPRPTFTYLATALRDKHPDMAYLHVIEPRLAGNTDAGTKQNENSDFLREIWNSGKGGEERIFISAGGYTRETALRTAEDKGGLVTFGRLYIANVRFPTHSLWYSVFTCWVTA